MKLTPLDIRHKEFKRGMRGYADVEVDEFLDEVADEYERLFKENIDLSERVETLEGQVGGYKRIEDTLQKTLVSAQASAEELKLNATKEAQLILHEAELKARQLVNDSYTEKQAIDQSMAKLKSADQDFRFRFKQLLDGYLKQLEETPAVAEKATSADSAHAEFARHAEAIKAAIEREGQSGPETPPAEAPVAGAAETASDEADDFRPVSPPSPDAAIPAEPGPGAGEHKKDRILFGESDDILSDVDSGVNENEFKW
jgi:cell division initiation protein